MFNQFTWADFFLTLILIIVIYYGIILYFFYRDDILVRFTKPKLAASPFSFQGEQRNNDDLEPDTEDEYLLQACTDEVTTYLEEAKRAKCIKAELLFALQRILQKYAPRLDGDMKRTMTIMLKAQCQDTCTVHLNDDDLKAVWLKGE